MSNVAAVVNGEVQQKKTDITGKKDNSSSLDKDAFLQLLVTQMKYQDPLEPTDNTEYVSQLANFSELEEMQNMVSSSDLSRASSLVGQYVTVKVADETTGESILKGGKVDYVVVENGKGYLNIDGENYSVDKLDSVVDETYLNAYNLATSFRSSLGQLPTLGNLTTAYKDVVDNLNEVLGNMSAYEKSFITQTEIDDLKKYSNKMDELVAMEEARKASSKEDDGQEESDNPDADANV